MKKISGRKIHIKQRLEIRAPTVEQPAIPENSQEDFREKWDKVSGRGRSKGEGCPHLGVDPSGLCEDSSLLWGPETHFRALRKRGTYHDWNDRVLYAWCQWGVVIGRWGDTRLLQRGDGVWIRLTGCSTRPQTHTAAGRASVISLQAKTISTYEKRYRHWEKWLSRKKSENPAMDCVVSLWRAVTATMPYSQLLTPQT